jgi:hypothetical protein
MTGETIFVLALIVVAALMMGSNRVRFDIVALLVVLALILSGVLSVKEALAGFGSPVVILVAGLLVVGEILDRTGVAHVVGDWILKKGGSDETRLLIVIMAGAALLGSVMSSTAIVAIFLPIVLRVAAETNRSASRLLLPMSYAALISGMLTLIASPPNLVVSEELKESGFDGFGFFSFTLVGLAILVVAIVYVVLIGRRLLPGETGEAGGQKAGRSIFELWEDFRLDQRYESVQLGPNATRAGRTLMDCALESQYDIDILGILRQGDTGEERIVSPAPDTELQPGDTLLIVGRPADHERLVAEQALMPYSASKRNLQRRNRLRQIYMNDRNCGI